MIQVLIWAQINSTEQIIVSCKSYLDANYLLDSLKPGMTGRILCIKRCRNPNEY